MEEKTKGGKVMDIRNFQDLQLNHVVMWPPGDSELLGYVAKRGGYIQIRNGTRVVMVPKRGDDGKAHDKKGS